MANSSNEYGPLELGNVLSARDKFFISLALLGGLSSSVVSFNSRPDPFTGAQAKAAFEVRDNKIEQNRIKNSEQNIDILAIRSKMHELELELVRHQSKPHER